MPTAGRAAGPEGGERRGMDVANVISAMYRRALARARGNCRLPGGAASFAHRRSAAAQDWASRAGRPTSDRQFHPCAQPPQRAVP